MNGAPTVHRAARFRRAARSLRRGTARCVSFAPVRTKRRGATCDARNTAAPAPSWTVHCRAFPSCRASVATRDDAMRSRCAGSRCALPGTGRHKWRPYGDIAARFRRAARPLRRGTTRCVPIAAVRTKRRGATCDARNTAAPAPSWTVHCRTFTSCRMFVAPRDDDTFPLRPVCTKRRGATPDARNTAASAPSWTVHCRMFPSCRASVATRDDAMRSHCGGSRCAACSLRHGTTTRFLCARFAPNVGPPPRTPGIPPHPRHHGRFTAACPR